MIEEERRVFVNITSDPLAVASQRTCTSITADKVGAWSDSAFCEREPAPRKKKP
jgi:hypothetical protein